MLTHCFANVVEGGVFEHHGSECQRVLLERFIERCEPVPGIRRRRSCAAVAAPQDADMQIFRQCRARL
jgi:hypothetical protein